MDQFQWGITHRSGLLTLNQTLLSFPWECCLGQLLNPRNIRSLYIISEMTFSTIFRQIWTNKMRLWSFSSRTVAQMLMVDITKFDCREKKFMKSSDFYNLWALYIHLLSAKWFAVLVWFISFMQTKILTNCQETIFFY